MSANPQNASLGLPDDGSPGNRLPDDRLTDGGSITENAVLSSSAGSRSAASSVTHAPGHEALQALLAFSSLHEQLRQRRALRKKRRTTGLPMSGSWSNSSWTKCCNWWRSAPSPLPEPTASPLPWPKAMQLFAGPRQELSRPNPEPARSEIRIFRSLPAYRRNRALRRFRERSAGKRAGLPPPGHTLHRGRADRFRTWHHRACWKLFLPNRTVSTTATFAV